MGAPMDKVEGLKWHLVAKTAGKGDPELDERSSDLSPEDRAKAEAAARKWTGTTTNDALTAAHLQGTQSVNPLTASGPFPHTDKPAHSCCYSALINVMVKAARRAGRSLKRDLGEIEHLQVSLKGPANFVTMADKRAEEMLYDDLTKARPGYGFIGEEGGTPRRRRQDPHLDRRSARRHHQLPARHPAIRDLDRPAARRHHHRRRDLQSRQ